MVSLLIVGADILPHLVRPETKFEIRIPKLETNSNIEDGRKRRTKKKIQGNRG